MVATVHIDGVIAKGGRDDTLFEVAAGSGVAIPSSCDRTGECGECIVEVTAGAEGLSATEDREAFLGPGFRLACRARIVSEGTVTHVRTLHRRNLRIETEGSAATRHVAGETGKGLAIDIGTTTVVLRLVDLATGAALAARGFENPQRFAGSDVIARIAYDAKDGRHHLRDTLSAFLAREIATLEGDLSDVRRVVVTGNPTMRDLFFGLDVQPLGRRPFRSVTENQAAGTALVSSAAAVGFDLPPDVPVYGLPLLGSHVGADVAGGLLATGCIGDSDRTWAYLDIGTNTELVASANGRVLAASCPSGPAFEGGRIARGMPAFAGAVERVRRNADDTLELTVIGDATPAGICGSGLVDCLALLADTGRVDELGRLTDGSSRFVLDAEHDLYLDERDIAELAQAKAAQAAGLGVLASRLGIRFADLDRICVAGAFGRHMDPTAAMRIGLLPEVPASRIELVGNAAVEGATRVLLSAADQGTIETFVQTVEHVELETDPAFFDLFAEGCRLRPLRKEGVG